MFKFDFPSEKAFEDYVWHHICQNKECPISGETVSFAYRQPPLSGYGIADIIKFFVSPCELSISVLELKNEPLKESHVSQVAKYREAVDYMIQPIKRRDSDYFYVSLTAQLAGPFDPDRSDFVYLLNHLQGIEVYDVGVSMEQGFHSEMVDDRWFSKGRKLSDRTRFRKNAFKTYRSAIKDFAAADTAILSEIPREVL